jgi:hypothetical protein
MRFLCVVYFEPATLEALSPTERATLNRDSLGYDVELQRKGKFIVANALQPVSTARTVRVRRGKASWTDGPFAETKEHLGGFILIEAAGMDEAAKLAEGIPMAKFGSIEVRPIMDIGPTKS